MNTVCVGAGARERGDRRRVREWEVWEVWTFVVNINHLDEEYHCKQFTKFQGWQDGSSVKNTCCFCRGPEFHSQHTPNGS